MANRRFVQRAARRSTFWEGGNIFFTGVATGSNVSQTLIPESSLENVPNSTLVRIRGSILVAATTGSTGALCIATLGIKLSTAAAVAGATVENPNADIGSDWIWWTTVGLSQQNTIATATPGPGPDTLVHRIDIDSKAMRKVPLNKVLVFVGSNVAVAGTMTYEVVGAARVLFKR